MIEFIAVAVTIFLIVVYILRPMAIPGLYFLLSNFFVIDLPFFHLNTSKIFAGSLILYFTYFIFINYKNILLDKFLKYILLVLSCITVVSIFHALYWNELPKLFTYTSLKGLWGFGFFFLPKEKINIKELFFFLIICLMISAVLITPTSIVYYDTTGRGFGRVLTTSNKLATSNIGIKKYIQFVMDDNTCENMVIMSSSLVSYMFYYFFNGTTKTFTLFLSMYVFLGYIFYINQYLISILILLLNPLIVILANLIFMKKNIITRYSVFALITIVVLSTMVFSSKDFINKYKDRFELNSKINENVIESEDMKYYNRISLFSYFLSNYVRENFWFGSGFPRNYSLTKSLKNEMQLVTGHSTILDNIISFGIIFGIMANFYYFYPIYLLLKRKIFLTIPFQEFLLFSTYFFSTFVMAIESIYGRESLQIGILIAMTCILLRSSNGEFKLANPEKT